MKYSLLTVRRRAQVLANLAMVLITPGGGGGKGGGGWCYRGNRFTRGQGSKRSVPKNADRAAAGTPPRPQGEGRKAPHAALPPATGLRAAGPGLGAPTALPLPVPRRRRPGLSPPPPPSPPPALSYSRLKWLRQARSTILARNRMAAPGPPPQHRPPGRRSPARRERWGRGRARAGVSQGKSGLRLEGPRAGGRQPGAGALSPRGALWPREESEALIGRWRRTELSGSLRHHSPGRPERAGDPKCSREGAVLSARAPHADRLPLHGAVSA